VPGVAVVVVALAELAEMEKQELLVTEAMDLQVI
tara:strand:+ start:213 stop:314 length:102 start_codon:yes stop_codon:yes gene_type:complete